jgi:ABC-2 type transport system permease protein
MEKKFYLKNKFNVILKYLKVYLIQLKNNWVREAIYRTNFLTAAFVDLIWIGVEFSLFTIIYANTKSLAGWTKEEVYFFLGVFFAADAFFTAFFQRNFWLFSDLINKGELDIFLTKPINPLFLALSRYMNLTAVFNIILGLAIMIKFSSYTNFNIYEVKNWGLVFFWLFISLTTQVLLRFSFCVWAFWTQRAFALSRLYYQFYMMASKPDSIYPKVIAYIIKTILPFALISSFPAKALLKKLSFKEFILVFFVLTFFYLLDLKLWKKGLKNYQSASS